MNKLWTVISQTYANQVKTWSFLLFILSPFLLIGISGGVGYFSGKVSSEQSTDQIAVISKEKSLRTSYIKQNKSDVKPKITTTKAARVALADNEIKGYLNLTTQNQQVIATYHGTEAMNSSLKNKTLAFLNSLQQSLNYRQAKLNQNQAQILAKQPNFAQKIKDNKNSTKKIAGTISFWIMVFMMYMILINYASVTANEIASEKGTKIMEIIFSSTTPANYFYGKLLGVVGVIVTQIAVYLVGGWAIFLGVKHLKVVNDFLTSSGSLIKEVVADLLNINLAFLLFGVIIYTILAAFSGALVAKAEDASKAAQPTVYLSMLAFFLTIPFQDNASALLVKILSYVPFFSSFFMPMRIIDHSASLFEISLSLLLLILAVVLMAAYVGHIYGGLMLQTEDTSFWKRFRRGLAYSK